MPSEPTLTEMLKELRPLMASNDADFDFKMPSMLRDIPSYTSDQTGSHGEQNIAELRRHTSSDF